MATNNIDVEAFQDSAVPSDIQPVVPLGVDSKGVQNVDITGVKPTEWPLWKLCLLALPQLGVQVMWCFLGPCSAPFMVHLGMGDSLATLNNVAGPIVGFFTGPLVGAWSDRCTSRLGRRRPIIIGGLISTWVAGILFSASDQLIPGTGAVAFAAPMFWVLDVTVNILQTPNRALVADLASADQQIPMQVVFVFMMAIGNFIGFSIMQIYTVPTDHMLELMLLICAINTVCVGIQFVVAKEVPLTCPESSTSSICDPVLTIMRAVKGMPRLLYHLALIQCLVWIGNTAWNSYGAQWFANSVYDGDQHAELGTPDRVAYGEGMSAFGRAGQLKSVLQLVSALVIIALLLKTSTRPRYVYAPCIFLGAIVGFLAAFAVGNSGVFATICLTISIMPETGSFAIPFGLVATLNEKAKTEGKEVSTALQMALLNCCVTVGQQICTMTLAAIEARLPVKEALPYVFMLAGVSLSLAGTGALFLNDRPPRTVSSE